MNDVTVIIPNYNGAAYLRPCLESLYAQDASLPVIVVDNASSDGSCKIVRESFPQARLLTLDQNYGFSRAVNEGIRASNTEFVILLNNDTVALEGFAAALVQAISRDERIFSCQAQMRQMDRPELLDSAGDFYCALGWARSRGKDAPIEKFQTEDQIFSACAGAAIYRRRVFEKIGFFDEAHFAYLEDVDIGYRARLAGWENRYAPQAAVLHKGSAASGSRYNRFKVRSAARNNLYLIYKNMPLWQIWINLPLLLAGMLVKLCFFTLKGMGGSYLKGLFQGVLLSRKGEKVRYLAENFDRCWKIQLELWKNMGYLFR